MMTDLGREISDGKTFLSLNTGDFFCYWHKCYIIRSYWALFLGQWSHLHLHLHLHTHTFNSEEAE